MNTQSSLDDEYEALQSLMADRIGEMVEHVLLETIFDLLGRYLDKKKSGRPPVCYRSDCKYRDEIPF